MLAFRLMVPMLLSAGLLTSACGGTSDTFTSPSAIAPSDPIGSSDRGPVPPSPPMPPGTGTCVASQAQWAIGERESDALLERARSAAQASIARFIRPNEPITLEYLASRLNLGLNQQGIVASVSCG